MGIAARDGLVWRHLFKAMDRSDAALQAQIRQALVGAIEGRVLPVGTRLPSSRRLAETLDVARNTVVFAYEQLIDEGYLVAQERSGVFVAAEGLGARRTALAPAPPPEDWSARFAIAPSRLRHIRKPRDWQSFPYPFLYGQFDAALFPAASWRECVAAASSRSSIADWAGDLIDEDDPDLIEQVCAQVLPRRGVWAARDELMITIGAQQALYLVTRLLVGPGTPVALEDPGYPDTRNMVTLAGGAIRRLPIDRDGADPRGAIDGCRVAFVTPGHQCPTTAVMSQPRRAALLAEAARHGTAIVEDDYDADLFAENSDAPPLRSLAGGGDVVYIGSLSKALAPGLRLGYVVAPAPVIAELRDLRRLMLRHPPSNNQRAMATFIALGHYRGHLMRVASTLGERAAAAEAALPEALTGFAWQRGACAASFWIEGPDGFDARTAEAAAREAGVLIEPGDVFFADPENGRRCFRLGLSAIRTQRIGEGLRRLGRAICA